MVILVVLALAASAEEIDSCRTISSPGLYALNQSLSTGGTCFKIGSDDVVLDGANYEVRGANSGYGVSLYNHSNVTVMNFASLKYFDYAIYMHTASETNISNNTLNYNTDGLHFVLSSNVTATSNTMRYNSDDGIEISQTDNSTLIGNAVNNNEDSGIYIKQCHSNNITNNQVNNNYNEGILVEEGVDNSFRDNNVNYNLFGFYLDHTNSSTIHNSSANSNLYGIRLENSHNNLVNGSPASYNTEYGLYLDPGSSNNQIYFNSFCHNGGNDIEDDDENSGDYNTCEKPENWNDTDTVGCTFDCGSTCYDQIDNDTCLSPGSCSCLETALNSGTCDTVLLEDSITGLSYTCIDNPGGFTDKELNCMGNTIDAVDAGAPLIRAVRLRGKSGNNITNCTFTDWEDAVYLYSASATLLYSNTLSDSRRNGVYMYSGTQNNLLANTLTNNGESGLYLHSTTNNTIFNNAVSSNSGEGIYMKESANNSIRSNSITGNTRDGIYFDSNSTQNNLSLNYVCSNYRGGGTYYDIRDDDSNSGRNNTCQLESNWDDHGVSACTELCHEVTYCYTIVGDGTCVSPGSCSCITEALNNNENCSKGVYLSSSASQSSTCINNPENFTNKFLDCQGNTIDGAGASNRRGVYLSNKDNATIQDCVFTNWDTGVYFNTVTNSDILSSESNHGQTGFDIYSSSGILGEGNSFLNNTEEAILLRSSADANLTNNSANFNDYGIRLSNSTGVLVQNNTIISSDENGIELANSDNNTIVSNNITRSRRNGIYFENTSNNNTLNSNYACYNNIADNDYYDIRDSDSNNGTDNICSLARGWTDAGVLSDCTLRCSYANRAPEIIDLILNASDHPVNSSSANLTGYINATDPDGDNVSYIYNWYREGSLNATSLVTNGLVAYYPLNNDSKDYWGSNDGEGVNNTLPVSGKVGNAYSFDGSSKYIDVTNNASLDMTKNLTISAWVYPESSIQGQTIYDNRYQFEFSEFGYALMMDDNSGFIFSAGDGSDRNENILIRSGSGELALDQWNLVTVTKAENAIDMYVDSSLVHSENLPFDDIVYDPDTYTHHFIGKRNDDYSGGVGFDTADAVFDGRIDELMIFNRTLSENEIARLYHGTAYGGRVLGPELTKPMETWTLGVRGGDYELWGDETESDPLNTSLDITDCMELSRPGDYRLQNDITDHTGSCFIVTADNVNLSLQGFSVFGDSSGADYGVYASDVAGLTVHNGSIGNFGRAVYGENLEDANVSSINTTSNHYYGLHFQGVVQSNFQNLISNDDEAAVRFAYSDNNNVRNIRAINPHSSSGIYILRSDLNNFTDLGSEGASQTGIEVEESSENNFTQLSSEDNGLGGIELSDGSGNSFTGMDIDSNGYSGLTVSSSNYNSFSGATISESSDDSLYIYNSDHNSFHDITMSSSTDSSSDGTFFMYASNVNTFTEISVLFSADRGLTVRNSNYNDFEDSSVAGVVEGIYFRSSSDNNVANSTFTDSDYSVYISSGTDNVFYNNSFLAGDILYARSDVAGNYFNTTQTIDGTPTAVGNAWGDITQLNIYDTGDDGYGDSGSAYPYSNANGAKVSSDVVDYGPIVSRVEFDVNWDWVDLNTTTPYTSTTVQARATDLANCTLYFNDTPMPYGNWTRAPSWEFKDQEIGYYVFKVSCVDNFDIEANTSTAWWEVVHSAPVIKWSWDHVDDDEYKSESANVSFYTDQNSSCVLQVDGSNETVSSNLVSPSRNNFWTELQLGEGNHTLMPICWNPYNLSSNTSAWLNVVVDMLPEIVTQKKEVTEINETPNIIEDIVEEPVRLSLDVSAPQLIKIERPGVHALRLNVTNDGEIDLSDVGLSFSTDTNISNVSISRDSLGDLLVGQSESVDLILDNPSLKSTYPLRYRVVLTAASADPEISAESTLEVILYSFLEDNKTQLESKMAFVRNLLNKNAPCRDFQENLEYVRGYVERGDYDKANRALNEISEACGILMSEMQVTKVSAPAAVTPEVDRISPFVFGLFISMMSIIAVVWAVKKSHRRRRTTR